jgi:hypothetical protein
LAFRQKVARDNSSPGSPPQRAIYWAVPDNIEPKIFVIKPALRLDFLQRLDGLDGR